MITKRKKSAGNFRGCKGLLKYGIQIVEIEIQDTEASRTGVSLSASDWLLVMNRFRRASFFEGAGSVKQKLNKMPKLSCREFMKALEIFRVARKEHTQLKEPIN